MNIPARLIASKRNPGNKSNPTLPHPSLRCEIKQVLLTPVATPLQL
jgi:hypothetical protein